MEIMVQSRLLENDELNEVSDLISVEEYFRGVYYLYWEDQRTLRKKIISAGRDISAFEILPITHEIAVKAAEMEVSLIKRGEALSLADILIAATAIEYNLIIITRNVKHFKKIQEIKIRKY